MRVQFSGAPKWRELAPYVEIHTFAEIHKRQIALFQRELVLGGNGMDKRIQLHAGIDVALNAQFAFQPYIITIFIAPVGTEQPIRLRNETDVRQQQITATARGWLRA